MGNDCSALCSKPRSKPSASPSPPVLVTHKDLRSRVAPTVLPSPSQVQALLKSYQNLAYGGFARRLEAALTRDSPVLDCREFEEVANRAKEAAINHYRSLFVQGSAGEVVPFEGILQGEEDLGKLCRQDLALFEYCNMYRSFLLCSALKKQLIESELLAKFTSKAGILRKYDQEAAGAYRLLCRNDLEILISQHSKSTPSVFIMSELKKQSVGDREILRREKRKAEELSSRVTPAEFRSHAGDTPSADSYGAVQSRLSVIDLISRLPEEEGKQGEYFTLQGEIVTRGPIKKHKSADDRPKRQICKQIGEEDSCRSQQIGKFVLNVDDEDNAKG